MTMKSGKHPAMPNRRVRGFTLVELLVSMFLGLLLVGVLLQTYLASMRASQMSQAVNQMNDDGQAALGTLVTFIRQAAYNPAPAVGASPRDLGVGDMPLFACDKGFQNVTGSPTAIQCSASGTSSAIAVAFIADAFNTAALTDATVPGGKVPTDCLGYRIGQSTDPSGSYYVSQARFYVSNGNLMCVGNGGNTPFSSPQSLVENVERLELRFGVAAPTAGTPTATVAAGYLTASQLGPMNGALPNIGVSAFDGLTAIQRWALVMTVRVCVVMRSTDLVLEGGKVDGSQDSRPKYLDCDGEYKLITDGRLRRSYVTTVALRNRMPT